MSKDFFEFKLKPDQEKVEKPTSIVPSFDIAGLVKSQKENTILSKGRLYNFNFNTVEGALLAGGAQFSIANWFNVIATNNDILIRSVRFGISVLDGPNLMFNEWCGDISFSARGISVANFNTPLPLVSLDGFINSTITDKCPVVDCNFLIQKGVQFQIETPTGIVLKIPVGAGGGSWQAFAMVTYEIF